VTSYSSNVSVAIGTNPSDGNLTGTTTVPASSGLASFSTLKIDSAGTGYTLGATSGSLTAATSNAFNVAVGPPAQLDFGQQPTSTTGGATISPAVTVRLLDAGGNQTASSNNVTLAITSGSGTSGAHLSDGTSVTVAASGGVANFSSLSIDSAGSGYTLRATSGALPAATSSSFTISVGAADHLIFLIQPSTTSAGATISPAVEVAIVDAGGNTVTTANDAITLDIAAGTGTPLAALSGTTTVSASGGVASFGDLSIDLVGSQYRLNASASGFSDALSSQFDITL
jgi:hypothetical protein